MMRQSVYSPVSLKYASLKSIFERAFMKYHATILQKADVIHRLPFKVAIAALHGGSQAYLIWETIFYWEDYNRKNYGKRRSYYAKH